MVTTKKRSTTKRAAPAKAAPAKAAPRRARRAKSGVTMIPSAMATAALVAVNYNGLKAAYTYVTGAKTIPRGVKNYFMADSTAAKAARSKIIGKDALIADVVAVAGGYVGGEIVKKYAPSVIKTPLGKIAKKIPKVF